MTGPLNQQQSIHFIGVGGIGMSGLALILVKRGFSVSGSDAGENFKTNNLNAQGIRIFKKQNANNIHEICKSTKLPPLIIVSSAIPKSNCELKAAQAANLKIWHRSDLLAELIKGQPSIAIGGSHGKTTTSTFITTLLAISNQDPTAIIGGVVPYYSSNAHSGNGKFLVAEADESDGTLVKFKADIGVITNLELDHTDHYSNINELITTFKEFGQGCTRLLANYDCPIIRKNFQPTFWWSIEKTKGIDFAALPISIKANQTIADIYEQGHIIGQIKLPMPGLHNLSNALSAIAACRIAGIGLDQLKAGIPHLEAPRRRFENRGIWKGRQIVDDYAHHPSEVAATIAMARLIVQENQGSFSNNPKRILVVFQPHRYSRTKKFFHEFAEALSQADSILLAPVYAAGEAPIENSNSHNLAKKIKQLKPDMEVNTAESMEELTFLVKSKSREEDLVIAMGAGNINSLWQRLNSVKNSGPWKSIIAA